MNRKVKYSKEVKIQACKDYQKGNGSFRSIAKSIGTKKSVIRLWYLRYKVHRCKAFERSNKNRSYSKSFKLLVIEEYKKDEGSIAELACFMGDYESKIIRTRKGR